MMRLLPSWSSAIPHRYHYSYGYPLALHALITLSSSHLRHATPSAASASRTTIVAAAMTTRAQQQPPAPPPSTSLPPSRRLARAIVDVISKTSEADRTSIAAPRPPPRICLAIAGGGSGSISSVASTPGASVSLVEGRVLYDRNSFAAFLGTYRPRSREDGSPAVSSSFSSPTSFVSRDAAVDLARCALHRCMRCTSRISTTISSVDDGGEGVVATTVESGMDTCVGVGCTSALATTRPRRGEHVCHVALADSSSGTVRSHRLTLSKGERSRWEEEEVVSSVVLLSILRYLREVGLEAENDVMEETITSMTREILKDGEVIEEDIISPPRVVRGPMDEGDDEPHAATSTDGGADAPPPTSCSSVPSMTGAREGAERVIRGEERAFMVVPTTLRGEGGSVGGRVASMTALSAQPVVLPADTIVFPGSFNPPHRGHVALANAAADALRRIVRREERVAHGGDDDGGGGSENRPVSVVFEMSLTNADKPPMKAEEAVRRLSNFATMAVDPSPSGGPDGGGADDGVTMMPDDWSVLLTAAPLFSEKVDILADCVGGADPMHRSRRLAFVIGTDTMVRILNPKYYEGNSRDAMMEAVRDMGRRGVHFIVGGRLEQGVDGGSDKFVSGSEEWSSLPPDVRDMFTLLSEDEFRADVSSTELRRKAAAAAASSMAGNGGTEKR